MRLLVLQFLIGITSVLVFTVIALKLKIVDRPGKLKIHRKPVPYLGGVAIALSVFIGCRMIHLECPFQFLTFGPLFMLLGLWDDIWNIKAKTRFLLEASFSLVLVLIGVKIPVFTPISMVFSWLLVMGAINSVNWMDGMDGLLGGVTLIVSAGFWYIAHTIGHPWIPRFMEIFTVSILGFLVFNFHPAKIFLGDAGSYFIGFTLAYISIELLKFKFSWSLFVSILAFLGVFVLDSTVAVIRRLRLKRHPFEGDRSHLYDQFHQATGSYWGTVLFMYAVALIGVLVGIGTFKFNSPYNFILWTFSVIISYGILFMLGFVSERFVYRMKTAKDLE